MSGGAVQRSTAPCPPRGPTQEFTDKEIAMDNRQEGRHGVVML